MPPKTIKLGKKDDIASVVKIIKDMRDREVIFELDAGSSMLRSSDNLKLMKRTGEALGKKIRVVTDDEIGRILAKKAGVLIETAEVRMPKSSLKVARSDVKPKFSDILGIGKSIKPGAKAMEQESKFALPKIAMPSMPKLGSKLGFSGSSRFTKILVSSLAGLILICFLLAVVLPKATITIAARSESVTRDFEIVVDKTITQADENNLEIPGFVINKEKSVTKNFPATGKQSVGVKAAGAVTLYNFTPNTLTLKASTTTLVVDGKKYRFTHDVTGLKPTTGTEANPNTASLIPPVPVIAEEGGESYNLAAETKFQVVNAALGNRNVYAINQAAITGGTTTTSATVVSQQDLDNAAAVLIKQIMDEAAAELTQAQGGTVLLVDSGVTKNILAKTANKNVGDSAESFDMTLIAKVSGLGFKSEDVVNVVVDKIKQVLSSDKYLADEGEGKYTAVFKNFDFAKGNGVLAVHFETRAAYRVNSDNVSKLLAGKNESEITEILLSKPEVETVTVNFWPGWLTHKAPRLNGKIYINTVLSNNQ